MRRATVSHPRSRRSQARALESSAAADPQGDCLGRRWSLAGCGRDAADSVAAHWGPAFSESKGISPAAADRCLQFAPRYSEAVCLIEFDEFRELARHANRSSQGPDGVPYLAWLTGGAFRRAFSTLRTRPWQPELSLPPSSTRRYWCSSRRAARRRAQMGTRLSQLSSASSSLAIVAKIRREKYKDK